MFYDTLYFQRLNPTQRSNLSSVNYVVHVTMLLVHAKHTMSCRPTYSSGCFQSGAFVIVQVKGLRGPDQDVKSFLAAPGSSPG